MGRASRGSGCGRFMRPAESFEAQGVFTAAAGAGQAAVRGRARPFAHVRKSHLAAGAVAFRLSSCRCWGGGGVVLGVPRRAAAVLVQVVDALNRMTAGRVSDDNIFSCREFSPPGYSRMRCDSLHAQSRSVDGVRGIRRRRERPGVSAAERRASPF
jgi:hypothetical protein